MLWAKMSFEIGVNAEWLKKQQHQIKDETILLLQGKTVQKNITHQILHQEWVNLECWFFYLDWTHHNQHLIKVCQLDGALSNCLRVGTYWAKHYHPNIITTGTATWRLSHSLHHNLHRLLTTVRTLPGFWMRSAFTTWNTSTMPSVLQHSVALMNEQNTPHWLTVSLCAVSVRKLNQTCQCQTEMELLVKLKERDQS